ncbi:MAG: DUF4038 domain-containing protein, partial [Chloroflexi bacterium]|nr:DUF4038 domain-containing protein [Chloroflexota bacterium]
TIQRFGTQNCATEWGYYSGKAYVDPFNEIELDVVFTDPAGQAWRVPAYWAGDNEWRVRFAPRTVGDYTFRTICTDAKNPDLHGQVGQMHVEPYTGDNPLLRHGPLRVSANGRHLEHIDGTAFQWLGDTWWMGLCNRLHWPDEFQMLAADRVAKGFTLVQIVAGLYPDMPAFDRRGFNEAGHPWEPDYARIRPAYFDAADLRMNWLVHAGLVPFLVGCWGYHLPWLGLKKAKQHWRNLVARYGAYPVIWCLAGEWDMPYYLAEDKQAAQKAQQRDWVEVGRYVASIDPYHHPMTAHQGTRPQDPVTGETLFDFQHLQTGHGGFESIPNTVNVVRAEYARVPAKPAVEGEVNYEGILEGSRQEVQRMAYWTVMLCGGAGYTYGANGIWQLNRADQPYGPSPHGASWGDTPWTEAYQLPGSTAVGLGAKLLRRYPWWEFEPHQEWVDPAATGDNYYLPYAAGIPGQVRVFYLPKGVTPWGKPIHVVGLEPEVTYRAFFFDPQSGAEHALGTVTGHERWQMPINPVMKDWVLVLEKATPPTSMAFRD